MTGRRLLAIDWGSSSLRGALLDADGRVLDQRAAARGMLTLDSPGAFADVFESTFGDWMDVPGTRCLMSGMVGSRQGWHEAPYCPCPAGLDELAAALVAVPHAVRGRARDVRLVPGLSCEHDGAPDVMRGEETQIAGLLQRSPGFDGVICMPGTHTKWVRVKDGKIAAFKSCMTGELFGLLAGQSVLRFSTGGDGWDDKEYADAVRAGLERPEGFAGALFSIRASSLIVGLSQAAANARLSGLVIGTELAATRAYWNSSSVSIVDNGRQAALYAAALRIAGATTALLPAQDVTLAGLRAAHANFMRETT